MSTGTPFSTYRQYDVAGNVVKSIDPRTYATSFDFADHYGAPDGAAQSNTPPSELGGLTSFAFATKVTNPLLHVAYRQFDYFLGLPVDQEDANGVVTSSTYSDALDRVTQVIRANNVSSVRNQTTFSYDDTNRVVTTTRDLSSYGDNQVKNAVVYDGLGRTVETRQYENATAYIKKPQSYDGMSRVWKVWNPYREGSETPYWTTTEYDGLGRVKTVTQPGSAVT
ncbi:MAG: hypothetical protein DMG07_05250, partial [Acidobacteria bacterium]